jgi:hypothetical protein
LVLLVVDWRADFGLFWPAMFATRMMRFVNEVGGKKELAPSPKVNPL